MELDRENRLGQVHIVVSVKQRICGRICQIVAVNITSADDDVLRNCPASVRNIEENEEMLEQCGSLVTAESVSVRLKDTVRITYGESKRVGSLLKAHHLPHKQERLNSLIEIFRSVVRHLFQGVRHKGEL